MTSVWSRTSVDALPVWKFRECCLTLPAAKLPSALLERMVTQPSAWAPEAGLCLRWIREGISVFYFHWRMTTVWWTGPILLRVTWKGWWQRPSEGRLEVDNVASTGMSHMWEQLDVRSCACVLSCAISYIYVPVSYAKPLYTTEGMEQGQR